MNIGVRMQRPTEQPRRRGKAASTEESEASVVQRRRRLIQNHSRGRNPSTTVLPRSRFKVMSLYLQAFNSTTYCPASNSFVVHGSNLYESRTK
ncbi:hypothetical protein EVAR_99823_1 [Eumeta japonica]|uniref:Uncharacterized protein n=1 Tax=Eumeta variegata TaxID=151549 RepID=A0A4C2A261_EUMVA|nr:hypothetical protein EVAR_99823_1 [Eumeta japonica]